MTTAGGLACAMEEVTGTTAIDAGNEISATAELTETTDLAAGKEQLAHR
ncbi:MAG: hypothetical protein R2932_39980 [Caldilineaceae bacterium]